jgi:hypothetical protein
VPWQNLSPDWQMSCLNLLAIATMMLGLKIVALLVPGGARARTARFLLSPMLAPTSLERAEPLNDLPACLWRGATHFFLLVLFYYLYWTVVDAFQLSALARSYLCTVAVLLMTETIAFLVTLLWLPGGCLMPAPHVNPFAARTVADFWGRRWNLWMSDWFRFAIFAPLRRRPGLALWLIFFVSGVLHEYVLNLTLWIVTGKNLFGTMMLYFLLQAVGVTVERRFLRNHPRTNWLFTWLIVFVPVPLVFNESMLRALHLWTNP